MTLSGNGLWPFTVEFVGMFTVEHAIATWFGGVDDPMDNGQTASGVNTKKNPTIEGCALPMDFGNLSPSTRGAPFPRMPWGLLASGLTSPGGTNVHVWPYNHDEQSLVFPLIDIGPARSASSAVSPREKAVAARIRRYLIATKVKLPHAIDLTPPAFLRLGGNLNVGVIEVGFRVVG